MNRGLFVGSASSAAAIAAAAGIGVFCVPSPARADIVWTPDLEESRAEFSLTHLSISEISGYAPFVSLDLATDDLGMPTRARAVLSAAHLSTDNRERDAELRSADFFDVAQYPTIVFENAAFAAAGASAGGLTAFTCVGDLTIKGIRKPVTLSGTITGRVPDGSGTERIGYSASATIDRRTFGLTDASMSPGGIPIFGNDAQIALRIEAARTT